MTFDKKPIVVSREIGGLDISIETGWMAKQASGSCMVRCGDNAVFVASVVGDPRGDGGFFPLTVDYRERTTAVGKFPGGFFKREGRPTTKETLTMRLTDRPIRPLFPEGYKNEVLVQGVVYSADGEIDPDLLNIVGASTSLCVSDAPFLGPIGAVRIGLVDDEFIPFPTNEERAKGDLDLVVAGTKDSISMVECSANEVPEEQMIEALEYAHELIQELCELQEELLKKVGKAKKEMPKPAELPKDIQTLVDKAKKAATPKIKKAIQVTEKHARKAAIKDVKKTVLVDTIGDGEGLDTLLKREEYDAKKKAVAGALDKLTKDAQRDMILKDSKRVDGRDLTTVRPIDIELDVLPRAHGSVLFTRGETQSLVTLTLGTKDDEQMVEGLQDRSFERFMLHYTFPPYCVNEIKRPGGPGRREIGHGMLAQRALTALVPEYESFPYTVRITSDIMESNGSSSMASVCGGSLAMMHGGVPLKSHVAGIAMGLISDGKTYKVLTDILGDEDHIGDMDFKVCGSEVGITALQMDVKLEEGLKKEVMADALGQAKKGRDHILDVMKKSVADKGKLSKYALKVEMVKINPELIGKVIGSGGKMIRSIEESTGCKINIEETGLIRAYGATEESVEKAATFIRSITEEPEQGKVYKGRVVTVKDFGAFVEILPGTEGMCHISELADGYVERVSDIVKPGDEIEVKVILIDDGGRIKLSAKAVQLEKEGRGDEYEANLPGGKKEGGRGGRDRDGGRGGRGGRDGGRGGRDRDGDRSERGGSDRPRRPRRDDDAEGGEDRPRRSRRDRDDDGGGSDRDDRPRRPRRDDADEAGGEDRPRRSRGRDRDRDGDDDGGDDRPRRSRGRGRDRDADDDGGDDRPRRSRGRDRDADGDDDGGDDRPRRPRRSRSDSDDNAGGDDDAPRRPRRRRSSSASGDRDDD